MPGRITLIVVCVSLFARVYGQVQLRDLVCRSERYYRNDTLYTGSYIVKQRDCVKEFVFEEGRMVQGRHEGKVLFRNSAAALIGEGTYVNGVKEGLWTDVRASPTECSEPAYYIEKGTYRSGIKTGYWTEYAGAAEGYYRNGQKEGTWTFYNQDFSDDGSTFRYVKAEQGKYVNGKKEGTWKKWSSKRLEEVAQYKNDMPDGDFISYYYNWQKNLPVKYTLKKGAYSKGKETGTWKIYNNFSASPLSIGSYEEGKMENLWAYYDEKGRVCLKRWYSEGVLLKEENFMRGDPAVICITENRYVNALLAEVIVTRKNAKNELLEVVVNKRDFDDELFEYEHTYYKYLDGKLFEVATLRQNENGQAEKRGITCTGIRDVICYSGGSRFYKDPKDVIKEDGRLSRKYDKGKVLELFIYRYQDGKQMLFAHRIYNKDTEAWQDF
ncbi:MAG: variant repeat protein [Bacteroidetes bacterium]|nr:variant repeat protein [Bacteroidota bacterium]